MVAFAHRDQLEVACEDTDGQSNIPLSPLADIDVVCLATASVEARAHPTDNSCWSELLSALPARKDYSAAELRVRLANHLVLEHRLASCVSSTAFVDSSCEDRENLVARPSIQMVLRKVFIWADVGSELAPRRDAILTPKAGTMSFEHLPSFPSLFRL